MLEKDDDCVGFYKECAYDAKDTKHKPCCANMKCHRNWPIDRRAWCVGNFDEENENDVL